MKKILLLLFALLTYLPLSAQAYDFAVGGLLYTITESNYVRVVGCYATVIDGIASYPDSIIVPRVVTHDSIEYYVRSIGPSAFADKSTIKSITLESKDYTSALDSIYSNAFKNCTGLTQLRIPYSVEWLGSKVFYGCKFDYLIIACDDWSCSSSAFTGLDTSTPLFYNCRYKSSSYISNVYDGEYAHFCYYSYKNYSGSTTWVKTKAIIASCRTSNYSSFECDLRGVTYSGYIQNFDEIEAEIYNNDDARGNLTTSFDASTQHATISGLESGMYYKIHIVPYYLSGNSYTAFTSVTPGFTTDEFTLTTGQPKVLSSTSAYISATTSLPDTETSVGFEWRKIDSPDEVASKSASAEIYDGVLAGVIKDLKESTYYKYRAYYKSAADSLYYSDWVGIDTDDYSYFEPTVKTGDVEVSDSYVTAKGYALQGTEDIEDQGFEYWVSSSSAKSSRVSSKASDDGVTRVTVDGQKMTATLTDLLASTTYEIRAYATTASGTTYGETVQFTTAEATGISSVTIDGSDELELLVRQGDGVQIAVSGGQKNECNYRIFSITGSMVASGKVATDGNWYIVADANTLKGIYVIIATDGSETKARKLFVK